MCGAASAAQIERDDRPSQPIALGQLMLLASSILIVSLGGVASSVFWAVAAVAVAIGLMLFLVQRERYNPIRLSHVVCRSQCAAVSGDLGDGFADLLHQR